MEFQIKGKFLVVLFHGCWKCANVYQKICGSHRQFSVFLYIRI